MNTSQEQELLNVLKDIADSLCKLANPMRTIFPEPTPVPQPQPPLIPYIVPHISPVNPITNTVPYMPDHSSAIICGGVGQATCTQEAQQNEPSIEA